MVFFIAIAIPVINVKGNLMLGHFLVRVKRSQLIILYVFIFIKLTIEHDVGNIQN